MGSYILYHCHSDYSLLDSATKFQDYIDLAVQNGQKAIAFTEHGKPLGWVSKKMACDKAGVRYIHGVEIYLTESLEEKVRDNYHTVLLAKNFDGLKEINQLVSKSCDEDHFYYTNRITFDEFLGLSDNIITTSACLASPLNKLSDDHPRYMELAKKYTFFEVQPHDHPEQIEFNKRLLKLSEETGTKLIAGTDTHNSSEYKAECRAVLMSAKKKMFGDEDSFDLTYKTYEELVSMFDRQGALPRDAYINAIQNTNLLLDITEDYSLDATIKYPILYGSREKDSEMFVDRIYKMLDDKLSKGIIPKEQEAAFREAISEELRVFQKLQMDGFMLSMSELISWCKEQGMAIGTARGSVGGSRIAYVTDIIDLNPETWNTVFSRFCNEDRVEIGDIDIDCIESDRPKIFEHIINRFGERYTGRVASYGTIAEKGAIDDIGRHLKFEWERKRQAVVNSDEWTCLMNGNYVPEECPWSLKEIDKIKEEYEHDAEKARKKYPELFYYFDGLTGTKVSQSVHPAGMIISPITLDDNYGVFDKDGESCLMVDMEEAHEVGLAKYDLLVLKTVQVIRDTCALIGKQYPKTHEIDWYDEKVWDDMLSSPAGLFQFESKFGFDSLKKFRPKSIFDMSLVTACIRPSGASYREDLLARKQHTNPSEIIDELLKDNLGYLIYQEDTIKFLQQICGLSGSASDNIRRAIGRKQKDRLDAAMPSILEGYCSKSKKPRREAEAEAKEFLQVIEDSASYQFGYNHSVAYCLLGYLCAYYRFYHPGEFITAFLNNAANDDDIKNGTALASRYGIKVTTPKYAVSRANYMYNGERNVIAKGLSSVKYMSETVADELYNLSQNKRFDTFVDLLSAIDRETSLNSRQLEILIKIDFFTEFGNQRELLRLVEIYDMFVGQGGEYRKKIKKEAIDGTSLEEAVRKYSVGTTKDGKEAKSYTLTDVPAIMRELEGLVKSVGMDDLSVLVKFQNFTEIMGYSGYTSGLEADRKKLYIKEVYSVARKKDGKVFGYNLLTQSIGSGKESKMTVFTRSYDKDPIKKGEIILCKKWERNGQYFNLLSYEHIYV